MSDTRNSPDPEDILLLAADAARLVLESGAETYRAEETAQAVCSALGGVEAECYATPTGIILSFFDEDGKVRSIVRRVTSRTMNLERIARVNALSRDLYAGHIDYSGASAEIENIERLQGYPAPILIGAAAMASCFFTLLFGGVWQDGLIGALIGALLSRFTRRLSNKGIPDFFNNMVGGFFVAFACLTAYRFKFIINMDTTIIGVIMLLVPGMAITNAIRDTIAGDLVAGVSRAAEAFIAAAAISIGAGFAFAIWQLLGLELVL